MLGNLKRLGIILVLFTLLLCMSGLSQQQTVYGATNQVIVNYFQITGDSTFFGANMGSSTNVRTALVDTGQTPGELLKKLQTNAIYSKMRVGSAHPYEKVIDHVFITHTHSDHVTGLKALLDSSNKPNEKGVFISNLYINVTTGTDANSLNEIKKYIKKYSKLINGVPNTDPTHKKLGYNKISNTYYITSKKQPVSGTISDPKTVKIDNKSGLAATIYPPLQNYSSTNNCSMLVKFHMGTKNFVFSGDIFKGAIENILATNEYTNGLRSSAGETTYLKVPHHASRVNVPKYVCNLSPNPGLPITYTKAVANQFTRNTAKENFYTYTPTGKSTENFDEKYIKMIKGDGRKITGIGNIKDQSKSQSDTTVMFALVGLDAYRDVAPKDSISPLLSVFKHQKDWGITTDIRKDYTYKLTFDY